MGGRGNSGLRNNSSAPVEFKYDEPVLKPLKPTRYAREIFTQNYREARTLVKNWGDKPFEMSNLYWADDNPAMSKQALRGVQALINSEKDEIELDVAYFGILTPEDAQKRRLALNAVQRTLNKQWNNR